MFDSDKDGFLNKDEITKFFTGFYLFSLYAKNGFGGSFGDVKQYAIGMSKKLFKRANAPGYPGISLAYFCSVEKIDF